MGALPAREGVCGGADRIPFLSSAIGESLILGTARLAETPQAATDKVLTEKKGACGSNEICIGIGLANVARSANVEGGADQIRFTMLGEEENLGSRGVDTDLASRFKTIPSR